MEFAKSFNAGGNSCTPEEQAALDEVRDAVRDLRPKSTTRAYTAKAQTFMVWSVVDVRFLASH